MAATRKLGSAVERNRAKRLAREVFRRHKMAAGLDIVIVPRREMLDAPFTSLEADYLAALDAASAPVTPTPPSVAAASSSGCFARISSLFRRCLQDAAASPVVRRLHDGGGARPRRRRGLWLGRPPLSRCHPFGGHGVDPGSPRLTSLMERRVFIAVFLSFLVLYGYQTLFVPPPPPAATAGTAATPAAPPQRQPAARPRQPLRRRHRRAEPAGAPSVIGETAEREIVVDTATVQATLTNRGGRDAALAAEGLSRHQGEPVDLVPSGLPADQPTPFSLRVDDDAITERLNTALYPRTGDTDGRVDARRRTATLVFEFQDAAAFARARSSASTRRTTSSRSRRRSTATASDAESDSLWGPGLGDIGALAGGGSFFTGNYVQPPQAIYHRDGDVERLDTGRRSSSSRCTKGQFRFAGIDDHYFIAAAVNPGQARVEYRPVTLARRRRDAAAAARADHHVSRSRRTNVRFFFGPKQFDLLRSIDAELVRAINFGMFAWLVVPLLAR